MMSRCYYLLDGNGILPYVLRKLSNIILRFVRGSYSSAPYKLLESPLSEGGLNCPSLTSRALAYDAKFVNLTSFLVQPPLPGELGCSPIWTSLPYSTLLLRSRSCPALLTLFYSPVIVSLPNCSPECAPPGSQFDVYVTTLDALSPLTLPC